MTSPIYCEHANEVPQTCPCPDRCYCKSHSCRGSVSASPTPTTGPLAGTYSHGQMIADLILMTLDLGVGLARAVRENDLKVMQENAFRIEYAYVMIETLRVESSLNPNKPAMEVYLDVERMVKGQFAEQEKVPNISFWEVLRKPKV